MITNITKDKGDTGLISIIKDLNDNGIKCCLPLSEHLPFDLIAVNENGKLLKISVKYKKLIKGGIKIPLKSVYSNTKGSFAKTIDFSLIDCIAVYCPELDKCYYVHVSELKKNVNCFCLRPREFIQRAKYSSQNNIAEDYTDVKKFFGNDANS